MDITKDPQAMQRLREAAEKAKCELSSAAQVSYKTESKKNQQCRLLSRPISIYRT